MRNRTLISTDARRLGIHPKYGMLYTILAIIVFTWMSVAAAFAHESNSTGQSTPKPHKTAVNPQTDEMKQVSSPDFAHIPPMELTVVRVLDDDFTPISDDDLREILATAQHMYHDKFGVNNVTFRDAGVLSIEEFFNTNLMRDPTIYEQKQARRFRIGQTNDFSRHQASIKSFIKNWTVAELQGFFPESERADYATHDDIVRGLEEQMQRKIKEIAGFTANKQPLLRPSKAELRSFLNWLAVLENQQDYDLVLTNAFILYDDMSQPSPHSIFSKCKVGGVSHKNAHRLALGGRVIMGSTFGMDTDIPFFMEREGVRTSRHDRNRVTGAFVIAHELGHAVFKLPDHYNHPPVCLMNNSKELTYREGFDLLTTHPGPCPLCKPWLAARDAFWDAEWAFDQKNWALAEDRYNVVVRTTPKNVDGYYPGYMAYVAYKLSKVYDATKRPDLALSRAETAVKLYRWDDTYVKWRDTLKTRHSPTPPENVVERVGGRP